jgi:hypothetical protein
MPSDDSNPRNKIGLRKAKENRPPFLMVDVKIWDNLSPYALKVYGQLRKLVDFREQHDEVKITVEVLSIKSSMSQRQTYKILRELENNHFLIKRLNKGNSLYNPIKSYQVSQTYGFFDLHKTLHQAQGKEDITLHNMQGNDDITLHSEHSTLHQVQGNPAPGAVPYMYQQSFQQSLQHVCGEADASTAHTVQNSSKSKAETNAIECEEVKNLFTQKFTGRDVTLQKLFEDCKMHYDQKGTWVTKKKFIQWIEREKTDNYIKIDSHAAQNQRMTSLFTEEENQLMLEALHAKRMQGLGQDIDIFINKEKLAKAEELFVRAKTHQPVQSSSCQPQSSSPRVNRRENSSQAASSIASLLTSLRRKSC